MIDLNIKWIASLTLAMIPLTQTAQAACVPADCASLGYTQAASECKEMIKCPFDTNKVKCLDEAEFPSCNSLAVAVGDLYYGSYGYCNIDIHNTLVAAGKTIHQPIGIIGYIDDTGQHGLVVALDEVKKDWSNQYYDLSCITNIATVNSAGYETNAQSALGGKANTQCAMSSASLNSTYNAAEYCSTYKVGTVTNWFLPASGEIYRTIYENGITINDSLSKILSTPLDGPYWSSTEFIRSDGTGNTNFVWTMSKSTSLMTGSNKKNMNYVRCFLEF